MGIWAAARAAILVRMGAVCNFDNAAIHVVVFGVSSLRKLAVDFIGSAQYAALLLLRLMRRLVWVSMLPSGQWKLLRV